MADPDLVSGTFEVLVTVSAGDRVVAQKVKVLLYVLIDGNYSLNITESSDQTAADGSSNGSSNTTATATSSSSTSESNSSTESVVEAANTTISEEEKVVS